MVYMSNENGEQENQAKGGQEGPGPDEVYCTSCGEIIKEQAVICPHCGVRQRPVEEVESPQTEEKSPGLAAVASAIIPGLGQIYNGQILKGIILMILLGFSIALMAVGIGFLTAFIVWIYAVYNAYNKAEKINEGG